MEFDELQKIWDVQTKEPMWVINETVLRNRVQAKTQQTFHITRISELLSIIVNAAAGSFVLAVNLAKSPANLAMYLLATWIFATALYVLVSRIRRLNGEKTFDRTVLGELAHAISMATYQVRLSRLLRWNMLPIVALTLLGVWEGGKSVWLLLGLIAFFALAYVASGWEHSIYAAKKRELEVLREKLTQ
ncbi:hypothetical protein [Fibrella forsythiae]|uniref:Uncharacterized protein n=1 Tax=Fibrella forsythiae TaxID=2817061 RepID=A0ABS3JM68_9BACT|nr:hypothetical protein [Fibrella forsythiae]MBO0951096.1 hypothetical protein [Fibrella forsythiae]